MNDQLCSYDDFTGDRAVSYCPIADGPCCGGCDSCPSLIHARKSQPELTLKELYLRCNS